MDCDDLKICEYKEGDLVEILAIENDSFPTPWSPALFHSEMNNPISRILVGRVESDRGTAVAGYIIFWRVADEIHLHNIAVRRDLRECGIASRLMSKVIRDCRLEGARFMTLEVRRSNVPARKLYDSFGFSVRGERSGYYKDTGEDALIMSVNLE
jgi:ribosomal-protein-alanine N-acetyltransferase